MKSDTGNKVISLLLPALMAKLGDWIYYITFMKMEDIARHIKLAEEIHKSEGLKEWIQRSLTARSKEIADYLLTQPQRFFNALIVGVYGGDPCWYEIEVKPNLGINLPKIPLGTKGAMGFLKLSGEEALFAIDGQHRVAGIRAALKSEEKMPETLPTEELCVIFIGHKRDENGMERTRRLFTTLNRYAKPVSLADIIALDEDDAVAITTRSLLDNHPLLSNGRISLTKGKALPAGDTESITNIITLYEMLDILLCDRSPRSWKNFKRFRPDENTVNSFYQQAMEFWDIMAEYFAVLHVISSAEMGTEVISQYRHRQGGHLLFRPVGILSISRAVKLATQSDMVLQETIKRISQVPMELAQEPWIGLLWDGLGNKMITRKENQNIATLLIFYMIGGDLSKAKITPDSLKRKYAAALNKIESEVVLPERTTNS